MRVLLLLFQSGFLLLFFMLWLLWPKLSKLCWIVVVRVGPLVLFLTLGEMISIFQMFAVGLSYIAFIMLRYVPSIPAFWRVFIINGCWILSKAFYWDNHAVFIFQFVNVVYYIDWFADIEESSYPWDKAHLVIMYDFFNMLLDSVC